MNANLLRSFALGILIATSLCALVYFSTSSGDTGTKTKEKISNEEMKSHLTDEGYVVLTEKELDKKIAAAKESVKSKEKESEKEKDKVQTADKNTNKDSNKTTNKDSSKNDSENKTNEPSVYKTVLTVTSGMTSIDVANALVNAHIIKADQKEHFVDEIEKRGIIQALRPGSYEVSSDMPLDTVIKTVYRQL